MIEITSIISVSFVHTADCGVPLVDRNVMLNYSSTLEGSVLILICENEPISNMNITDEQTLSVTCHSNGNWIPNPAQFTCSSFTTQTTVSHLQIIIISRDAHAEFICSSSFLLHHLVLSTQCTWG